jgi:predicted HTH domain antitoxin
MNPRNRYVDKNTMLVSEFDRYVPTRSLETLSKHYGDKEKMAQLCLKIPDDMLQAMKLPPGETHIRYELAIRLYEKGLLSFGKARELAHLNRWGFHIK